MGLDMYAYSMSVQPSKEFGFAVAEGIEAAELAYWRKHANLHGWMRDLYVEKGGNEVFNCVNLHLTKEDLLSLKQALSTRGLQQATGFFWGDSSGDKEEVLEDLAFVDAALEEIAKGRYVFYSSWW